MQKIHITLSDKDSVILETSRPLNERERRVLIADAVELLVALMSSTPKGAKTKEGPYELWMPLIKDQMPPTQKPLRPENRWSETNY